MSVRFTYATNGHQIRGVDMATGTEADAVAFPSPDELWAATFAEANAWRDRFAAVPFQDKGGTFGGRYYQDAAINAALEAVAEDRKRILLTLATGTGKTFIAFQIAWKLFHARWNLTDAGNPEAPTRRPRILFLADRNILADQAFNAFSARSRRTRWCGSTRPTSRRRVGCRRTAASSSRSSRRSCPARTRRRVQSVLR